MVLMKDVIDVSQRATLGRHIFPGRSKVLSVSYTDALSVGPYSFLIVDAPGEDPIIYIPKDL